MKRILAAAVVAIAIAAPAVASASTSGSARGAGTVLSYGTTGGTAFFRIDFSKGKGGKILYANRKAHVYFHSQVIGAPRFTATAMKVRGWGFVNGKLVPFTAVATDHPAPIGDWFKITWGRGAARGGRLTSGNIDISALLAATASGGLPSAR